MRSSLERCDELFKFLLCFCTGSLMMAVVIGLMEGHNQAQTIHKPQVSQTIVYDCINIQHAPSPESYPPNHTARYALIRLQKACEQQENALALMHIWQQDPAAGAVLEP